MILHEKTKQEFGYTFETASNYKKFYCICDYCGNEFLRHKRTIIQSNKTITKDSCGIGICKKTKGEEAQLALYGVKNKGSTQECVKKRRITCKKIYGDEEYNRTEFAKEKNRENYDGCDYPIQSDKVKQKVKATRVVNSGYDHHTKDPRYQKKLKEKNLAELGVDSHFKTDECKAKTRKTIRERYDVDSFFKSEEFAQLMKNRPPNINYGKTQKEIRQFLESFGCEFNSDRAILSGKEIDLYNADLGLAFEYCGLFWHHELSPQPRIKGYHQEKYLKCKAKGVRLITIFEDEWRLKNAQCKGFINSVLGKNEKVYARKCEIKEISSKEVNAFCDLYHIQGKPKKCLFSCGLFLNGDLLGIMSLGPHHRGGKDIVLNRLCYKSGIQVIGGSKRLLSRCEKWCLENGRDKIISWSDNRWSVGDVYKNMGFILDGELPPDYSYVLAGGGKVIRLSKQSCRKSAKKCPEGKTEREWMAENGYARIWDCGKIRWIKTIGMKT